MLQSQHKHLNLDIRSNIVEKKVKRINNLLDIVRSRNGVSIKELAQILNVSEMTIRRDMEILRTNNLVKNISGVAVYNSDNNISKLNSDYELDTESVRQEQEKVRIGKFAASFIEPNDVIIIGTGSTTIHLAPHVPSNMNITAICYAMNILMELHKNPGIRLIFAGGYYHRDTQMFESPEGLELIRNARATKLFVSAMGVHDTMGVTLMQNYQTLTKRAAFQSSLEKILMVDSSKFGRVCNAYYAQLNEFDTVITDNRISDEWRMRVEDQGVKLYIV